MGDTAYHTAEKTLDFRRREIAETQRIHGADGARTHGENIPDDAAYAGSRTLEGLDCAGVIVRLHLESDGQIIANIDDAGIFFAGTDQIFFERVGNCFSKGLVFL